MLSRSRAKIALKKIGSFVLPVMDSLFLLGGRPPVDDAKVLIVRLDLIGDFVLWSETGKQLSDHYRARGKHVVLLGHSSWAGWAKDLHIADEVWAVQPSQLMKNLRYRINWLRRIRRAGFSVAVQPTFSRELLTGDSLVRASAAPQRIGSAGDFTNTPPLLKWFTDRWYTQLIPARGDARMELQRHAEFLQGLTGQPTQATIPFLPSATSLLPSMTPQTPYAVIFPAASWVGRMWPAARFAEIAERLIARDIHIVLAGGPADHTFANPIAEQLKGHVTNLVGKTSLPQLAELLRQSCLVVSNETSAMHIAVAVNTPVMCILGGGHYGRFAPYAVDHVEPIQHLPATAHHPMSCFGCNWTCIYSRAASDPVPCVDKISVEQVWNGIANLLDVHQSSGQRSHDCV